MKNRNDALDPARMMVGQVAFFVVAIVALIVGAWAGLLLLGWNLPISDELAASHGGLIVSGFLGTLFSLERAAELAATLKKPLTKALSYVPPSLTAIGVIAVLIGMDDAAIFMVLGSISYLIVCGFLYYLRRSLDPFFVGAGGAGWFLGNVEWLVNEPPTRLIALYWLVFLMLTLIESQFRRGQIRFQSQLISLWVITGTAAVAWGVYWADSSLENGVRLMGAGQLSVAVWLYVFDSARHKVQEIRLSKYVGVCLLNAYFWLAMGGLIGFAFGGEMSSARYYIFLHAGFLGFAFSMIFAHAPIICQTLFGSAMHYRQGLFAHVVLLNLGMIISIGGKLLSNEMLGRLGGMVSTVALVAFLLNVAWSLRDTPTK